MTGPLERRYQRLLALYPPAHRREYGEEMLGVMLAGAGPEQRYPRLGETVNVALAAAGQRIGRFGGAIVGGRWVDAFAVLGVLAPILVLARSLRIPATELGWYLRAGQTFTSVDDPALWPRIAAWAAVTVIVLFGRWRYGAAVAGLAVGGEAVAQLTQPYDQQPFTLIWPVLLAVLAAGAVTGAAVGRAGPVAGRGGVLGRVRAALFLLAGLVGAGAAVVLPLLSEVGPWGPMPSLGTALITRFGEVTYGLIIVLLAGAIAGITAPVRRRVLTLMLPVAVLLAVAELGSDHAFSGAVPVPALLGGASEIWWLIGAPLTAFVAGLVVISRRERPHSEPDRLAD